LTDPVATARGTDLLVLPDLNDSISLLTDSHLQLPVLMQFGLPSLIHTAALARWSKTPSHKLPTVETVSEAEKLTLVHRAKAAV